MAAVAAVAIAVELGTTGSSGAAHRDLRTSSRAGHAPNGRTPAVPRSGNQQLSLAQLAGQRIIYAYSGLKPPASLLAAIRAGEAAGVILFGPNVVTRGQTHAVVKELQHAAGVSPVHAPLLVLVDQEGGVGRRLPGAPSLSERQIGESANGPMLAREAGAGAARNLSPTGIDVNLAPVLDVFRRRGDFIDEFGRSYASNPQVVARLGRAFIRSQQQLGVAATAKHFPGLGAAARSQNTDASLVTLDLPRKQLRSVDEAPYRGAIAAGVKLVMTSWAVYPALDPQLPAGLSAAVIQAELRGRLRFRGVTITDTIASGALSSFGTLAQRGILAARAGADLIICSEINPDDNTPRDGATVLRGLARALAHGKLSRAAAQQAAARVLALRLHP